MFIAQPSVLFTSESFMVCGSLWWLTARWIEKRGASNVYRVRLEIDNMTAYSEEVHVMSMYESEVLSEARKTIRNYLKIMLTDY